MNNNGYLLGLDLGSSSIKATLLDSQKGRAVASASSPEEEMKMIAKNPGWAEQNPEDWWTHIKNACSSVREKAADAYKDVSAIGITYQMHGLVLLDKNKQVLRPSIIWSDSRAVPYGEKAFKDIGEEECLRKLLNSPGNFTAAKLAWVKENEPDVYENIHKMMLPGDYIAFRLSGEICTTPSGVSEGILWNAEEDKPAGFLMDYFGFSQDFLPEIKPTFSVQGELISEAADELSLQKGIPISYRAGDQPNNAFTFNVLNPGEMAATAGTSGVVYSITAEPSYDRKSRVNTFVHVNYTSEQRRYGILLCLNGTGILNRWIKQNLSGDMSYEELNEAASQAPIGSKGLVFLPYGNGAERTLQNKDPGALIQGLNFNMHEFSHLARAGQEGIVFALRYGMEIMREMGVEVSSVKAGYTNMFMSPLFADAFATSLGTPVYLYNADGSQGAARGAGVGAGIYSHFEEAFVGLDHVKTIEPRSDLKEAYENAYGKWREVLEERVLRSYS